MRLNRNTMGMLIMSFGLVHMIYV